MSNNTTYYQSVKSLPRGDWNPSRGCDGNPLASVAPFGNALASGSIFTSSSRSDRGFPAEGGKNQCEATASTGASRVLYSVNEQVAAPLPSYVRNCGQWCLALWKRGTGQHERKFVQYRCMSWRCPKCVGRRAARDRERILGALNSRSPDWAFVVLTLNQRRYGNPFDGYAHLQQLWPKLRKRLTRAFGPIEYVATVEQHATGYPHLNLLLHNKSLAALARDPATRAATFRDLKRAAVECGFGFKCWLDPVNDNRAAAGYLAKAAKRSISGEVSKTSQIPLAAPKGFRRIRASRGLLPRKPQSEFTGQLIKAPLDVIERINAWEANLLKENSNTFGVKASLKSNRGAGLNYWTNLASIASVPARPTQNARAVLAENSSVAVATSDLFSMREFYSKKAG